MLSFQLLLCTVIASVTAFQGSGSSFHLKNQGSLNSQGFHDGLLIPSSKLAATAGVGWTMESTADVQHLLTRARNCVYNSEEGGGECSVEEASDMLQDLTFLLANCRYGNLGTHNAVCEDQDVAAEVVAKLRMITSSSSSPSTTVAKTVTSESTVSETKGGQGETPAWAEMLWKILTDYEVPTAIIFYFACIAFLVQMDQLSDIEELNAKMNEYYLSPASHVPSAMYYSRIF